METVELFHRFGIALAIGLLIGVERGWRERDDAAGSRVAGIRTYGLICLLGAIWGGLVPVIGPWPLVVSGLGMGMAVALFQWREGVAHEQFSATGVVASFVTFALGAFALLGDTAVAGAAGIAAVALLTARELLHDFLRRITWQEIRSAVVLLAMTFIALPILPDRTIDPWQAVNPRDIWLMTVMIAAISYAGYIVVRLTADRVALIYSAMAGALISSTTVTLLNARLGKTSPSHGGAAAAAICIGWIVSLLRMTAVASVLSIALLPVLVGPIAAAVVVLAAAAGVFYARSTEEGPAKPSFGNPFDLGPVLGFGLLLTAILVVTKIAHNAFGQSGLLPLAAVSGFADVDPITISVAKLSGAGLAPQVAAAAVLLAATSNMLTKIGVCVVFGGARFGLPLVLVGVGAIAAAGTAFALWP